MSAVLIYVFRQVRCVAKIMATVSFPCSTEAGCSSEHMLSP